MRWGKLPIHRDGVGCPHHHTLYHSAKKNVQLEVGCNGGHYPLRKRGDGSAYPVPVSSVAKRCSVIFEACTASCCKDYLSKHLGGANEQDRDSHSLPEIAGRLCATLHAFPCFRPVMVHQQCLSTMASCAPKPRWRNHRCHGDAFRCHEQPFSSHL